MRRAWLVLLGGLVVAVAAYVLFYRAATAQHRSVQRSGRPELAWLQQEFNLSDAEYTRVCSLHAAYVPRCAEMCRRIDERNGELQKLLANADRLTREIEKALAEVALLRVDCEKNMLRHFFEVSRSMPPEQGQRYLRWVREQTVASRLHTRHALAHDATADGHSRHR
ncbi:MAG: periplasmic heavy metal sensor [Verrucomicrobia bacterium]|nr:periplasmic heavy metal sensor [Verrucomicrobiota bacterium]